MSSSIPEGFRIGYSATIKVYFKGLEGSKVYPIRSVYALEEDAERHAREVALPKIVDRLRNTGIFEIDASRSEITVEDFWVQDAVWQQQVTG